MKKIKKAQDPATLITTAEEFTKWATHAKKGDRVSYYRGWLMRDRMSLKPYQLRLAGAVERFNIAAKAWDFMEMNLIRLVQSRQGTDDYLYIAVKA